MSTPLAGVTVVVTRPAKQAAPLCQLIEAAGGSAITFPTLEIAEPETAPQLERLDRFNLAIFISANAVAGAARFIKTPPPDTLRLAAVGKQTANTLKALWQRPVICPEAEANSETLLALPELQQIEGQRILIVRGQGGRELLAEVLAQRGAIVEYAEVYRRIKPDVDLSALQTTPIIDVITATSNASLQNLYDMADASTRPWLLSKPLAVISERTAALARQLGFRQTMVAPEASDQGLLNAIIAWRTTTSPGS